MNNINIARKHLHEFLAEQVRHALTSALGVHCIIEALISGSRAFNIPKEFGDTLLKGRREFVELLTTEQCVVMYHTGEVPDKYRPDFIDEKVWDLVKTDAEQRLKLYKGVMEHLAFDMFNALKEKGYE